MIDFRGNDKSHDSSNRRNFIEVVNLMARCNIDINNVVLDNALGNFNKSMIDFRGNDKSHDSSNRRNFIKVVNLMARCNIDINNVVLDNALGNFNKSMIDFRGNDKSHDSSNRRNFIEVVNLMARCNIDINNVVLDNALGNFKTLNLKNEITAVLGSQKLLIEKLHSQGYSGASNMYGTWNELQIGGLNDTVFLRFAVARMGTILLVRVHRFLSYMYEYPLLHMYMLCSMYFDDIETIFNRPKRNYDGGGCENFSELSVFMLLESDGNVNGRNRVIMFNCGWWDIGNRSRTHIDEYGFLNVKYVKDLLPQQSGSASNATFQLLHQCGSALIGKRKSQSLLPIRISPRKMANVRLFGARVTRADGPLRAKEATVESQEIQLTKVGLYIRSHVTLVKDWSDIDKKVKKDMIEYLQERLVELRELTSLSEDEIFVKVLPSKSTIFRGISVIPKPTNSYGSKEVAALRKELDEYKERKRENNATYLELLKKNRELECRLALMENKLLILIKFHEKRFNSLEKELGVQSGFFDTRNGNSSHRGKVI
ncbi:hypothetical protein FNV43_RR04270 [Rhamnella rubrinervis]|uniref:Uncharacterized protein n=1 Tax=Rhamnella rubrinervis TaxID=2594499 RepID=A0A8K0MPW7_9ROSA|nr:hypothetical protein FNV43_RR04270 [Rhamnella rubrinervis]